MFGLTAPKPPKLPPQPTVTVQAVTSEAATDKRCCIHEGPCFGEGCMAWVRLAENGAGNCAHILQALSVVAKATKSKVATG